MANKKRRKPSDRMASKGRPNPVDVHVGRRLRARRTILGISQEKLGEQLGLTFQQIQKYERGTNRVSSSRLFDLTRVLDVPIAYFFDEMGDDVAAQSPGTLQGRVPDMIEVQLDPTARRETLELVRAYYRIPDEQVRRKLVNMIRSIAAGE